MEQPAPPTTTLHELVLAVSSTHATGALLNLHTGHAVKSFRQCTAAPGAVTALSGDRPHFAIVQKNGGFFRFYDADGNAGEKKAHVPEKLSALAASHSGGAGARLVAAGSESGKVYLWDLASGALLNVVDAHFQAVTAVAFSADDMVIATASADAGVKVFEIASLADATTPTTPLHSLAAHTLPVTALHFTSSPSHTARLLTCSADHAVKIHDVATGTLLATYLLPSPARCLATDPLDSALYAGADDGNIYTHPLTSPPTAVTAVRRTFARLGSKVTALAVSRAGGHVVAGTNAGVVVVLDAATGTRMRDARPFADGAPVSALLPWIVADGVKAEMPVVARLERARASGDAPAVVLPPPSVGEDGEGWMVSADPMAAFGDAMRAVLEAAEARE
ncbi:Pre-rRNA-processing protein ipi3 [Blastocladiella emersonii ATCC 22665]|nr:Pre-rRNA-processing protein ipi3 [Blastocladiella emersonii ATCC 22665]